MNYSDDTLMAYADGALDAQATRELDLAVQADPALAAIVARHRALRADVFAAFAPVLDEVVPQRLADAAGAVDRAKVVPAPGLGTLLASAKPRWSWPEWGGLAAMLVLGLTLGRLTGLDQQEEWMAAGGNNGVLAAHGALAQALSQQLASAPTTGAAAHIGVSFVAKDGRYCRSFSTAASAGLACRQDGQWQIAIMTAASGNTTAYRQAGSSMPPVVLDVIDQFIAGSPLDAGAEAAAAASGWQNAKVTPRP